MINKTIEESAYLTCAFEITSEVNEDEFKEL